MGFSPGKTVEITRSKLPHPRRFYAGEAVLQDGSKNSGWDSVRLAGRFCQAVLTHITDQIHPAVQAEFISEVAAVAFDRAHAER